MCEETADSGLPHTAEHERERTRSELLRLIERRDALEKQRQEVTSEIHAALRRAYEAGWSWEAVAQMAGYRSAAVARSQAASRSELPDSVDHARQAYTVREAADRLNVTPQTIYNWIGTGRIRRADSHARDRRVYLPDEVDSVE